MTRVDVYSRHDAYIGTIGTDALLSFTHTDELNGDDSVTISTTFPLAEGQRLVWEDGRGVAHEHVCQDPKATRAEGMPVYTDTALNSICETFGDYIVDKRPHAYAFARALGVALEPTRWEVGTVDQPGSVSDGLTFYHTSAREAVSAILQCGGELETEVAVGRSGVSSRKVGIRAHRGQSGGHRRFAYGKDLLSVSRTEHWGAITACYGYGKGVETGAGGYGRKLTFGDVNGGLDYVEDSEALALYGRPDGDGKAHVFGEFEDSDCTDAKALLEETRAYLDAHKTPGVTYEASVVDLVAMGRDWEGVAVGDDVRIVDTCFDPVLRCQGRVTKLVSDELAGTFEVTIGNVTETMADVWVSQQRRVSGLMARSAGWDVAASTPAAYLQQVIDGLNEQFNLNGMSYCHTSFERGTVWASVPMDSDGRPTKTGGFAMQVCSQGFRIASGTMADGSWDWRTFGTGEGFVADYITTGSLSAALIKTGMLMDATGKSYWDMATGEMQLFGYASADEAVTGVSVEYAVGDSFVDAPESGWSPSTPTWEAGRYVWQRTATTIGGKASYSKPTCIQGAAGSDGVAGPAGKDGESTYFHVKYAPVENPTAEQMTETPDRFIGTYVDGTEADSGDPKAYVWVRIEGLDGRDGADGTPGTDGRDGTTYYLHIAYASSPDGSLDFSTTDSDGRAYMGQCVDEVESDPETRESYTWSLIKGADGAPGRDGTDGKDGLQGPAGKDGASTYFHRAYAESADGKTGFSVAYASGKSYLGTYVDGVEEDSEDPARYAWSLIKGRDGRDGVDGTPGVDGRDGTTYYLHRAYAENEDGTAGFSTTDTVGKSYMGTCVDASEKDPTDPAAYKWALIKGSDGSDGLGVKALEAQYYVSTSKTSVTGGSWGTVPKWERGKHTWTRTKVTWSDGSTTYTPAVLAAAINSANESADEASSAAKALNTLIRADKSGVIVGKSEDGTTYATARTLQGADGAFHVQDSGGTDLATYAAKLIALGINSEDCEISMCGGKASMSYGVDTSFSGGKGFSMSSSAGISVVGMVGAKIAYGHEKLRDAAYVIATKRSVSIAAGNGVDDKYMSGPHILLSGYGSDGFTRSSVITISAENLNLYTGIGNGGLADFATQQGCTDGVYWTKYVSGRCELHGYVTLSSDGSGSQVGTTVTLPFGVSNNVVTTSAQGGTAGYAGTKPPYVEINPSETKIRTFRLYVYPSDYGTYGVSWHMYGLWK